MLRLTIFFDEQYWVGILEAGEGEVVRVHRFIFGGEPSGPEVYEFVLHELCTLLRQPGATMTAELSAPKAINPKRKAREAARTTAEHGISSAAQEAMRLQIEVNKKERRVDARDKRRQEADARFARAKAKAKEKHRGH